MERENPQRTEKRCQSCSRQIFGRSDKKYCDDQCRNTYNNKLNSDSSNYMRRVNNILRKNRRILQDIAQSKNLKRTREQLYFEGYNFKFFTTYDKTTEGIELWYCYDMGLMILDNENVRVITNDTAQSNS
jgi:hypothetical protein